jgi:tripartite-type tricarboxylate transporter receptor subunit TctC
MQRHAPGAVVAGLLLFIAPVSAQTWPSQSIKLIVPIAPGSVTDVASRFLAQELQARLGQPVVVVNKPGGNMVIGAQECARAEPDGYTLCVLGSDAMSYNPFLLNQLPYDPDKDFKPVTNMYFVKEAVLASENTPAKTMDEFKALAKARPGKLNFGTLGSGSTLDIFRKWLSDEWKTDFAAVPYKGGSEIVNAALGGQIDVTRIGLGNVAGFFKDPRLKVLAVRSEKRLPELPDVPTTKEAGIGAYPGVPWWGLVAPAKTPDAVVARVGKEVREILSDAKSQEFMNKQFLETAVGSPEEFAAFLRKDRAATGELISKYGHN